MLRRDDRRPVRAVGLLLALMLAAAACGGGGEETASETPAAEEEASEAEASEAVESESESAAEAVACGEGEPVDVSLNINPAIIGYLPYFVAVDQGFFEDAGLNVEVTRFSGPTDAQMPALAQGDFDIMPVVSNPSLFNLFGEGFSVKLLAATGEEREGALSNTKMIARQDLYDSGELTSIDDLAGRTIDAAAPGTVLDYHVKRALEEAGLTAEDVTLSYVGRLPPDMEQTLRNQVVDVQTTFEPIATLLQQQGLGTSIAGSGDVMPGFQNAYVAASETFLEEDPQAAACFLQGLREAAAFIEEADNEWTPELVETANTWSEIPPPVIESLEGLPAVPEDLALDEELLMSVQEQWIADDLVQEEVPIDTMVDLQPLESLG